MQELEGPEAMSLTEADYGYVSRFHRPFYIGRKPYIERTHPRRKRLLRLQGSGRRTAREGHTISTEGAWRTTEGEGEEGRDEGNEVGNGERNYAKWFERFMRQRGKGRKGRTREMRWETVSEIMPSGLSQEEGACDRHVAEGMRSEREGERETDGKQRARLCLVVRVREKTGV